MSRQSYRDILFPSEEEQSLSINYDACLNAKEGAKYLFIL